MNVRSLLTLSVLVGALTLSAGTAMAQPEGDRGDRRDRGDRGDRRERFENMSDEQREQLRERFAQRMQERQQREAERLQDELGATDEEFALLNPRIEKIRTLQRERMMAERMGGNDRRGGPGGFFGADVELSEQGQALRDAAQSLRESLEDEDASADAIKQALTSLRETRAAMDTQVKAAQEELRGLLTARQEASMVVQGVLE